MRKLWLGFHQLLQGQYGTERIANACAVTECIRGLKLSGKVRVQIFATDIDKDAVDRARQGLYPPSIATDVSPERLERYFSKEEFGYRVSKQIREMVVFAPQNIMMDPPFMKLDLLCCRNLLIYFTTLPLHPQPRRILFLGSSETIGGFHDLFSPINSKWKIFKHRESRSAKAALIDMSIAVLFVAFDEHRRAVAWNHESERVTGYRAKDMIGRTESFKLLTSTMGLTKTKRGNR